MDQKAFFAELERLFGVCNAGVFAGRLRTPVHVIQHDKKVVFRFQSDSYHIVIGSLFGITPVQKIVGLYLHEMVHLDNFLRGEDDHTSNQYHNKKFLEAALRAGFYVSRHKTQGWAITDLIPPTDAPNVDVRFPQPTFLKRRQAALSGFKLNEEAIRFARSEIRGMVNAEPPKQYFLKYVCKCNPPYNSVRTGRRPDGKHKLNATCNDCNSKFVCIDVPQETEE